MATVKYYNSSTSQWEPILYGIQGDTGETGATGATNSLSIGTVTNGLTAGASITGSAPSQTLNLVLPLNANAIDANSIQTITNKMITFADNTLTGVASTATSQTLTNKTIAFGSNSISGTLAEFNTALTNADFATLAGTETLTNKTINGSNNTLTNISLTTAITGTLPVANGGTGVTTSTGSGSNVLGTSPTIASPTITGNLIVDTDTFFVDSVNDKVGIGTTSFTVGSTINSNAKIHLVGGGIASMSYGAETGLSTGRANGTSSSPTQLLSGERMSYIIGSGYFTGASSGFANTASIGFYGTQNYTDTTRGSSIYFETVLTGGTARAARVLIDGSGHLVPATTNTYDLGTSSLRWRNIFTQDLHLSNGIGDYTIIEGEEDLFLVNNKNKKSFKFMLKEVDNSEVPPKSDS